MSPRVSPNQLGEIARRMSERDGRILALVAELRIAASRHIEGLIFTEGSALTRARRARAALARLTDLEVLARLDRRIGGVRAGSSGYLYRLGHPGRRLLGLKATSGWREPGREFVAHTLAAADLHLAMVEATRQGRIEGYEVDHEPDAWRRFIGLGGASQWLKPDLFVRVLEAEFELVWFIEIDRSTESTTRIATKAEQYLAYWRTGIEQQRPGSDGVFPRVAWIAPDQQRVTAIERAIASTGDTATSMHVVTTTAGAIGTLAGEASNRGKYENQSKGGQP